MRGRFLFDLRLQDVGLLVGPGCAAQSVAKFAKVFGQPVTRQLLRQFLAQRGLAHAFGTDHRDAANDRRLCHARHDSCQTAARQRFQPTTASEAKMFDATKWLGQWIERPQPALGGRKPADLLDTPTGVELVARLLGSIESGAYQ